MASSPVTTLRRPLGEILVESGKVSPAELERALELQKETGERLGRLLVNLGVLPERDLLEALSRQLGVPIVPSAQFPSIPLEIRGLSPRFMSSASFFPFELDGNQLRIAMADPLEHETLDSIRLATGLEPVAYLALETEIQDAIEKFHGAGSSYLTRLAESFGEGESGAEVAEGEDVERLRDLAQEAPVIRMVTLLISRAVESRASDIHIEPLEKDLRVRFRIDGVLYPVEAPPRQMGPAVVSRIKLMAKLNIAERRLPQDGRIGLKVLGRDIDLRVATLPTIYGESVVMRILDRGGSAAVDLEKLGFSTQMLDRTVVLTARPHGIFLVTGPTGSGKSTTLYSVLLRINDTEKKIVTLEDPVEYQIGGVNQIQVSPQIGLTFAAGLRHIVRQDPDVIMVGEIRDLETAEIAIRAALTGHLVFSTLHTNDAPSAITRLVDMGVPAYLLSSSIIAILAQRLVRRLCPECRSPYTVSAGELPFPLPAGESSARLYRPAGCPACRQIGFRQRMGIFELMEVDEEMCRLIVQTSEANRLAEAAKRRGMKTLRQDGFDKALAGLTTVEEVLRVTQESN